MTHRDIWQRRFLYLTAGLLSFCATAGADSLLYDFEQEGTSTVLASLELSMLPATHEEVVRLTFTPAGQEIFGWDFAVYPGTFTTTCIPFMDDGEGGLWGDDFCFTDPPYIKSHDPPPSTVSSLTAQSFLMFVSSPFTDVDTLRLWLFDPVNGGAPDEFVDEYISADGHWRIVPEPSSCVLCLWTSMCAMSWRRVMRRPIR